jgi:hypothetical protein
MGEGAEERLVEVEVAGHLVEEELRGRRIGLREGHAERDVAVLAARHVELAGLEVEPVRGQVRLPDRGVHAVLRLVRDELALGDDAPRRGDRHGEVEARHRGPVGRDPEGRSREEDAGLLDRARRTIPDDEREVRRLPHGVVDLARVGDPHLVKARLAEGDRVARPAVRRRDRERDRLAVDENRAGDREPLRQQEGQLATPLHGGAVHDPQPVSRGIELHREIVAEDPGRLPGGGDGGEHENQGQGGDEPHRATSLGNGPMIGGGRKFDPQGRAGRVRPGDVPGGSPGLAPPPIEENPGPEHPPRGLAWGLCGELRKSFLMFGLCCPWIAFRPPDFG